MTEAEVRKLFRKQYPKASYSPKKKGFIFKCGFFYRHGQTDTKYAKGKMDEVNEFFTKNSIPAVALYIDCSEHWNAWPKDSWFEAVITFKLREDLIVPTLDNQV